MGRWVLCSTERTMDVASPENSATSRWESRKLLRRAAMALPTFIMAILSPAQRRAVPLIAAPADEPAPARHRAPRAGETVPDPPTAG